MLRALTGFGSGDYIKILNSTNKTSNSQRLGFKANQDEFF